MFQYNDKFELQANMSRLAREELRHFEQVIASLLKSEARHFQDYLKLAYLYGDEADVDAKIEEVRLAERELIESPDEDFRFHSGVPA